jgi:hypothetical protein
MSFKFDIYTLVDITNTGAKRNQDPYAYKQYQNYLTVLQTIGLRVNPVVEKDPALVKDHPAFGKKFVGEQKVWKLPIEIEYEGALNIDMLVNDFSLVPFIDGLDETVKFQQCVFDTTSNDFKNIIFVDNDK